MPYQLLRNMIILPGSTVVTFQRCPQSSAMTPQPASVPDSRSWPWHNLLPSRWSLTTDRVPGNPLVCPCSGDGCAALLENTLLVQHTLTECIHTTNTFQGEPKAPPLPWLPQGPSVRSVRREGGRDILRADNHHQPFTATKPLSHRNLGISHEVELRETKVSRKYIYCLEIYIFLPHDAKIFQHFCHSLILLKSHTFRNATRNPYGISWV